MWPFTRKESAEKSANILDPIHDTLDPRMWDDPASPEPTLKPEHAKFIHRKIYATLEEHGYDGVERWLNIVLTGSLTTYQYSDLSDCDVSLFIDSTNLPEWSRAEMIGIMVKYCDGTLVPGTPFPLQDYVVSRKLSPDDLYKPGLRSGYDIAEGKWIVPPDKSRVHDVEHEYNLAYTQALEAADKMDRLIKFEPLQAARYWHTIHKKRMRDMQHGLGDFSNSNIVYKMLANRGMFEEISKLTGEHIAKLAEYDYRMEHSAPGPEESGPFHEIEETNPDFYSHPEYYTTHEPRHDRESVQKLMQARGKPNQPVTIYRAGPTSQINPGDWVTQSRNYAIDHAKHATDPSQDMPVWRQRVPASTLFTAGDSIHEWGYHGPALQGIGKPAPPPFVVPEMDAGELNWATNLAAGDGKDWQQLTDAEKQPYVERMIIKPKQREAAVEEPQYNSLDELAEAHAPNVDAHATESPITGAINLHSLMVSPQNQNQGHAGAYMRDLVNYADQNQKTIALNAEAYGGEPGLRTNQLKKWYQSFGFIPNKGRNKDFTFKENHVRYPQSG